MNTAVVVGSGLAGLATAAYLANAGVSGLAGLPLTPALSPISNGGTVMMELDDQMAQAIRLQMLFNIGNGWSWYAYKRLGPEKIIELELEMWKDLLPPAIDLLFGLVAPEGPPAGQGRFFLDQMTKINGYVPKYLEENDDVLKWEYTTCPNWSSLEMLKFDDYLAVGGKPARVSCIHGCTKVHEIYFSKIAPNTTVEHFELRPNADATCVFKATFK